MIENAKPPCTCCNLNQPFLSAFLISFLKNINQGNVLQKSGLCDRTNRFTQPYKRDCVAKGMRLDQVHGM